METLSKVSLPLFSKQCPAHQSSDVILTFIVLHQIWQKKLGPYHSLFQRAKEPKRISTFYLKWNSSKMLLTDENMMNQLTDFT
jgi:hypothetical protein